MTAVSFFAGMGGFDLAFEQAGFEIVLQIEIDLQCQKLLRFKYAGGELVTDILAIAAVHRRLRLRKKIENYERWKRIIDILTNADVFCGGWPCQDLSVAGQRAGLAGDRSGLWFALRRIIALFRPTWFVGENVPGLLSSHEGRDFREVVSGLEKLGYWWAYRTLDCQFFNLAQRRERVFIVAGPSARGVSQILFESKSLCWDPPPSRETGKRTAATIGSSTPSRRNGGSNPTEGHFVSHALSSEGADASEDGTGRGTPIIAGTLAASGAGTERPAGQHNEHDFCVPVCPTIGGVSNGGGANGPGRDVDSCESLIPVTAKRLGGHHRHDDLDNETYIPERARRLRARANCSHREDSETFVMAHGQANSEIVRDGEPSLTCNHEAPIAIRTSGNCGPFVQGDKTGALNTATDPNQNIVLVPPTPIQSVNMVSEKKQNGIGIGQPGDEMFTLTRHDQHAIAFDTTQITSDKNYSKPKEGDPCHPLASKAHPPATAFSSKDSGNDVTSDLSPTLRAMPHDKSHSNGGGQMAIATAMQVRRLTPTECLRLMGYEDSYFDGLNFSDSVKYRLIGNSVAIPVVTWIARRLKSAIEHDERK